MTAKRKRRRSRSGSSPTVPTGEDPADAPTGSEEDTASVAEADAPTRGSRRAPSEEEGERPPGGGLFGGRPSPYPPLGVSLATGLRTAASWPAIVGMAFLSELVLWVIYVALGFPPPPGAMAGLMAIPPINLLVDVPLSRTVAQGTVALLGVSLGIALIRSVTLGMLTVMVVDALREGRPSLRRSLRRLRRVTGGLMQVLVLEVAGFVVALYLVGAFLPAFGQMGVLLIMVFGLHFLGMAPVILAAEDVRPPDALRLAFRAGRLPGFRHFGLVMGYFLLTVAVLLQVGAGFLPPVTPSILIWSFGLVATLLHVGVLGALAFRWLAVRDEPALRLGEARGGSNASRPTSKGPRGSGGNRRRGTGSSRQSPQRPKR
jgi:hypothetical protein